MTTPRPLLETPFTSLLRDPPDLSQIAPGLSALNVGSRTVVREPLYRDQLEKLARELRATQNIGADTPEPTDGASAGRILDLAKTAVTTDRSKTHGDKERSFEAIANLWTAYLENRKPRDLYEAENPGDRPIRAYDVAQMMVLLKMCRAEHGTPIEDQFVDQAGYSAVAGELA